MTNRIVTFQVFVQYSLTGYFPNCRTSSKFSIPPGPRGSFILLQKIIQRISGAGLFERVLKEQEEEAPKEEGDPGDDDGPPNLIPPSPHLYGPSVTAHSPVVPATMSDPSVSKISSLCPDMLIFFQIAFLGHRDTDTVLLACQEKGYHNIVQFRMISDAQSKIVFQDYDTNGDGTGTQKPIMPGTQFEIPPAIAYCKLHFSNSSDPVRIKPQYWEKDEYMDFYFRF